MILEFNSKTSLKIIQVYAPTTTHDDDKIEEFYETVTEALEKYKATQIGNFGYDCINDRSETLLNFMELQKLFAMNTFFHKKPQKKWT